MMNGHYLCKDYVVFSIAITIVVVVVGVVVSVVVEFGVLWDLARVKL